MEYPTFMSDFARIDWKLEEENSSKFHGNYDELYKNM
jgi:hypothetical protein